MLVAAALLLVQLVNLQVVRASHFVSVSNSQLVSDVQITPLRAPIYDRNGQALAMSVPVTAAVVDDNFVYHPAREAAVLATVLGAPESTIYKALTSMVLYKGKLERNGEAVLSANVTPLVAKELNANPALYPGVTTISSSQRTYPDGSLASSVIGTQQSTGIGSAGIEYEFQHLLAGSGGLERILRSPNYDVRLPSTQVTVLRKPVTGTGLELTIDAPLQFVTEQALGTELVDAHALSGTAIVMDTQTGQILSMANLINTNEQDPLLPQSQHWITPTGVPGVFDAQNNLAVTNTYEPGSVFKIVPFSAALLAGQITPTTPFSIPDQVVIDNHLFHDAEQHGLLRYTATQILEYSSNIGTYEISQRVGESGLLAGVERLGFGQPTGLNFPGESSGLLMNAAGFSPTDIAALPIGQEDAVTPLQVLDAYNTIADGGTFITPSLVRARVTAAGTVVPVAKPMSRRALPSDVASTLTNMLVQVVSGGTGTSAGVAGYTIAGKTGTAQIPYPGRAAYIPGAYNATFVGFAPAEHPVLSMIVVIQRPTPVIYGGYVSAPVFARVMGYALHRYGVPSTRGVTPVLSGGSVSFLQDVT